jgi:hypothetical protein
LNFIVVIGALVRTEEFPSYQGRDGNSFVKIAAANAPTGVDMLGITNLDGSNGTQLV